MTEADIPDWPPAFEDAAEESQLGELVAWDRADLRAVSVGGAATGLICGVFVVVWGSILAYFDQQESGEWWRSSGLIGVGLILFLIGVWLLLRRGKPAWVALFEEGLVGQPVDKGPVAIRWTEVERVSRYDVQWSVNGARHAIRYNTSVHGAGRTVSVTDIFPAAKDLMERIVSTTAEVMLPQMARQLDAGESIAFGDFTLDRSRLSYDGRKVTWSQIDSIDIKAGELRIRAEGRKWASVPAVGFPNFAVFMTLTDALCRAHQTSTNQPDREPS